MDDRQFWLLIRQALLLFVDAIERRYGLKRTADLRHEEAWILAKHPSE